MGCDDVRRVAYFFLDGTLGPPVEQQFVEHLQLCNDCEARMQLQKRLRIFIRSRLSPVGAPDRLRVRLTRTLRAVTIEPSV